MSKDIGEQFAMMNEVSAKISQKTFDKFVAEAMAEKQRVHVFLEHFNVEMQYLLDEYVSKDVKFEELENQYRSIGTESHDIKHF